MTYTDNRYNRGASVPSALDRHLAGLINAETPDDSDGEGLGDEAPCPHDPGGQHFVGCGCDDVDLGFDDVDLDDEPLCHGRSCSSDPTIGCECGLADRDPTTCGDCGGVLAERSICDCHGGFDSFTPDERDAYLDGPPWLLALAERCVDCDTRSPFLARGLCPACTLAHLEGTALSYLEA